MKKSARNIKNIILTTSQSVRIAMPQIMSSASPLVPVSHVIVNTTLLSCLVMAMAVSDINEKRAACHPPLSLSIRITKKTDRPTGKEEINTELTRISTIQARQNITKNNFFRRDLANSKLYQCFRLKKI